jgi:hypothetical protein
VLSNLSFLLFERLTVPRDFVQNLSALSRANQNCSAFSWQLEFPIRFFLLSLVWAVSNGKNGAFNLVHFTVGAQFEKAEKNRIDQENRASIRNVEQEKMSIVDYFLLLPADQFEDGSASRLLQNTRTGDGQLYLCDAEPRDKYVDEKFGRGELRQFDLVE